MAEVIGIVSGAIAFVTVVAQVTKSITEIKDCWDHVRDAPEDLQRLIREVEIFGLILADIQKDLSQDSVSSILQGNNHALQSLELCKEASADLRAVSEGLMSDVRTTKGLKRSYASLKIVIKKSNVEKYRTRLGSATRLLSLSQQCYTRALIQAQPDLIVARIQVGLERSQNTKNENDMEAAKGSIMMQNSITRRSPRTDYLWRLMMPSWITSQCLEVEHSGWQWHLRTYNIIPDDSAIMELAFQGDTGALQQIFSAGKASPFDVTDDGTTLITAACAGRRYETVKFLIEQGAKIDCDVPSPSQLLYSPLSRLCMSDPSDSDKGVSIIPLLRLFSKYNDELDGQDSPQELLYQFNGTAEEFVFLQQNFFPSFNDLKTSEPKRASLTKPFLQYYYPGGSEELPKILRILLRGISFTDCPSEFKSYSDFLERKDLLYLPPLIAEELGFRQAIEQSYGNPAGYESMFRLFKEFLVGGYDINQKDHSSDTPFDSFCSGYLKMVRKRAINSRVNSGLQSWLRDLQKCGVDLRKFGQKTGKNFKESYWRREIDRKYSGETAFHLIGFSHGPNPEDWKLWISEPSDFFAGQFWEMTERRMEMPGGWSDVHLFL